MQMSGAGCRPPPRRDPSVPEGEVPRHRAVEGPDLGGEVLLLQALRELGVRRAMKRSVCSMP